MSILQWAKPINGNQNRINYSMRRASGLNASETTAINTELKLINNTTPTNNKTKATFDTKSFKSRVIVAKYLLYTKFSPCFFTANLILLRGKSMQQYLKLQ